jgi:hypothetical protein
MPNDLTFTQSANLTAVPLQNVTLSITPSANFTVRKFLYQWRVGSSDILDASSATYTFDAPTSGEYTYTCAVTALTGVNRLFAYAETSSPGTLLKVVADDSIFTRHLPNGANHLNETGYERFMRIRNLGYC